MNKKKTYEKVELTNEPCKQCLLLGDTVTNFWGRSELIFYTISPDPYLRGYSNLMPDEQAKRIVWAFQEMLKSMTKKYTISRYSIHYEFDKQYKIHVHGLIEVPACHSGYLLPLVDIGKKISNKLGRPKTRYDVCCKTEWVKDKTKCCQYVNKENVFKGIHVTTKDITIFDFMDIVRDSVEDSQSAIGKWKEYKREEQIKIENVLTEMALTDLKAV